MKRLIVLISVLMISMTVFSQKTDMLYHHDIVNAGVSDKNDISMMFADRFYKRIYGSVEYEYNYKIEKESFLGGVGIGSNKAVALVKAGMSYGRDENYRLTQKFDYGLEYLWLLNTRKRITLCYGMAYTHCSGVQFKMGTSF